MDRAKENLALIGPAGTGKTRTLIALGHAAVTAGHEVSCLTAAGDSNHGQDLTR